MFEITFLAKYICIFFKIKCVIRLNQKPNRTKPNYNSTKPNRKANLNSVWFGSRFDPKKTFNRINRITENRTDQQP